MILLRQDLIECKTQCVYGLISVVWGKICHTLSRNVHASAGNNIHSYVYNIVTSGIHMHIEDANKKITYEKEVYN